MKLKKSINLYIVLSAIAIAMLFIFNESYANPDNEKTSDKDKLVGGFCPITQVRGKLSDCTECHALKTWKIIESEPFEEWIMPNHMSSMTIEDNKPVGVFQIKGSVGGTDSNNLASFHNYLSLNHKEVKKIIIELHSPGGNLFEGYKIVGMLKHYKSQGYEIETRVHGFAASAAFLIFCAGDIRSISPQAELMWHELITFKMFAVSGPADKENQAAVLRHLQDTANTMISEISKMTKEELDQAIRKKEFWVNGKKAIEMGFATKLLE